MKKADDDLFVLCATLLGVDGYYEKMRDLIKK